MGPVTAVAVTPDALATPVTELDCASMTTREVNAALRELPPGSTARIVNVQGRHNVAVGLSHHLDIEIDGHAGYFIGALGDGPSITVNGFVGWSLAENLMSGTVRVLGNASECCGATSHGGAIIVHGDASSRAGISLKGAELAIGGDVGHMSGFMAQAGTLLVGGDAGEALGDSLYEAVIYVGGKVRCLGADTRVKDLNDADVLVVKELVAASGFDGIDPQNVTKVASAKTLYNFDALKNQSY